MKTFNIKQTLTFLLFLISFNLKSQIVFPLPATGVTTSSLNAPPTLSSNQCMMWNGTSWDYIDWDAYGSTLFSLWDQDESDDFDGSWSSLTGVPTTFNPSIHTHLITDVTGLQTVLDGKFNNPTGTISQYIRGDGTLGTTPIPAVNSVNGQTGTVVLTKSDIGLSNVPNTDATLRSNHTGTQLANTISNFQTTVSSNTDVAANTAVRHTHSNLTILDNTTASYTTTEQSKLSGIATGAEVNVNADWNAVSGDAQILNKPTLDGSETKINAGIGGITLSGTGTIASPYIISTDPNYIDLVQDGPQINLEVTSNILQATINTNSIGNTEIGAGAIQTSELGDEAVTAVKLNQMGAASGQVMKWNGTAWVAANDENGGVSDGNKVDLTVTGNSWILNSNSVTSAKITDATITSSDIALNTITSSNLVQSPPLTFKGNNTGSTNNTLDLSITQTKIALGLLSVITLGTNQATTGITFPGTPITGFTFVADPNSNYEIKVVGAFQSNLVTSGIGVVLDVPDGTVSGLITHQLATQTLTGHSQVADAVAAHASAGTSGIPAINTPVALKAEWLYSSGIAGGTVTVNFKAEVASTVQINSGTKMIIRKL